MGKMRILESCSEKILVRSFDNLFESGESMSPFYQGLIGALFLSYACCGGFLTSWCL